MINQEMNEQRIEGLLKHSTGNKTILMEAERCGCYYCTSTFKSAFIKTYCVELNGEQTAICPVCGIDAVVPTSKVKELLALGARQFTKEKCQS